MDLITLALAKKNTQKEIEKAFKGEEKEVIAAEWIENIRMDRSTNECANATIVGSSVTLSKIKIQDLQSCAYIGHGEDIWGIASKSRLTTPDQVFNITPDENGNFSITAKITTTVYMDDSTGLPFDVPEVINERKTLKFNFNWDKNTQVSTIVVKNLYFDNETPGDDYIVISFELSVLSTQIEGMSLELLNIQKKIAEQDIQISQQQQQINDLHCEWIGDNIYPTGARRALIYHKEGLYFPQPKRLRVTISPDGWFIASSEAKWGEVLEHPEMHTPCSYEYGEYTQDKDGKTGNYVIVFPPTDDSFYIDNTYNGNTLEIYTVLPESINDKLANLKTTVQTISTTKANIKDVTAKISSWKDYNIASDFPDAAAVFYPDSTPTKIKGDVTVKQFYYDYDTDEEIENYYHYTFEQDGLGDITFDDGNTIGFMYFDVMDDNWEVISLGIAMYLKGEGMISTDPGANGYAEPPGIEGAAFGQHWVEGTVSAYVPVNTLAGKAIEELDSQIADIKTTLNEILKKLN